MTSGVRVSVDRLSGQQPKGYGVYTSENVRIHFPTAPCSEVAPQRIQGCIMLARKTPAQAMEPLTSGPCQRASLHGAMSLQAAVGGL